VGAINAVGNCSEYGYFLVHLDRCDGCHADVSFGSKADMALVNRDDRFTPESGHSVLQGRCPLSANSGRQEGSLCGSNTAGNFGCLCALDPYAPT
jgi:hypothetical protein